MSKRKSVTLPQVSKCSVGVADNKRHLFAVMVLMSVPTVKRVIHELINNKCFYFNHENIAPVECFSLHRIYISTRNCIVIS